MIYSFDIFDTCLVRKCGTPANLFYFLARKYYGEDKDYDLYKDFVHNRKEAEKDALNRTKKKSVTIEEIYLSMEETFGYKNASTIMHLEMELEAEMLSPVYVIKEQITACRKKSGYVVFISDMYLPKDFLEKILVDNGLKEKNDKLYISCEYNATKNDGSLFKLVSKDINNEKYSKWIHVGDNEYSDCLVPRKLGIKVKKISHPYSFYENFYVENQFYSQCKEECLFFGSLLKAFRLKEKTTYARDFTIDVIASVYIPYVFWIMNDAKIKGINHILFLARDSEIFYNTAKALSNIYPNIKLSYIYVSRKSLLLPSLLELTKDELNSYIGNCVGLTPKIIFKRLNIEDISHELNIDINTKLNKNGIIDLIKLLTTGEIKKRILLKSKEYRKIFIEYLLQNNVKREEKLALVDLGWTGSSRCAINKILNSEGFNEAITYYWGYFGGTSPSFSYINAGKVRGFNHFTDNENISLPNFVMLMEHYFSMTKDGTTLSYKKEENNKIIPIKAVPENFSNEVVDLHNNIMVEITKNIINYNSLRNNLDNIYFYCGKRIWTSFIVYPQKEDINLLKDLIISEDSNSYLISRLNFLQRLQLSLTDNVFGAVVGWKTGTLYNSPLRKLYYFLYTHIRGKRISILINNVLFFIYRKIK